MKFTVRENNELIPDSPKFDPHIGLCYIKSPGTYPAELLKKLETKLTGKYVDFDSVNFYSGDDKIGLIKL